jgi:hypothetical protein
MLNVQTTGSGMEMEFRDLQLDGQPLDLSTFAGWERTETKWSFKIGTCGRSTYTSKAKRLGCRSSTKDSDGG